MNGIILFCLLPFVLFGMLIAMAVMAPEIESWPILTLFSLGSIFTGFGLYFMKATQTTSQRWSGYIIHGGSLAIYILLTVVCATSWLRATRRMFLVPAGFKGDLYVLHIPSGEKFATGQWRTKYFVPSDGILITGDPLPQTMNDEYAYLLAGGRNTRITDVEMSTISDTPTNRRDRDQPIIFFPRTGSTTLRSGCTVQFEQVYVGTKADLLTSYKQTDLQSYVENHPHLCRPK
jgi:hypothetical protein